MYGESYLIEGTNQSEIRNNIDKLRIECGIQNVKGPDILTLEPVGRSIGISEIHKAQDFLKIKPLISKKKLLVIYEAQKLTPDAQNALLKTLEEPSAFSTIVLSADRAENLLETVTSRCKRIRANESFSPNSELLGLAENFARSGVGDRLSIIEKNKGLFTDRNETSKFLDHLSFVLRKDISKQNSPLLSKILKIQSDITNTNVNCRLAIETLALT